MKIFDEKVEEWARELSDHAYSGDHALEGPCTLAA